MQLDEECKACLYKSQLKKVEKTQSDVAKVEYFKSQVKSLCDNPPQNYCAPLLMRDIDGLHKQIFGGSIDYSSEKSMFNKLLLGLYDDLLSRIMSDADPLKSAIKYAMAANYLDFARLSDLNVDSVSEVLTAAEKADVDDDALSLLKEKLSSAKTLAYFHDNCGEIVLDKILITVIKKLYTNVTVFSVVRGKNIINDVTKTDADEIGLGEVATVVDNGTNVPGTYLKEINAQAKQLLNCDVVISKGLGNLETLFGEGYSVFYMFMSKCLHIAKRFNKNLWQTALVAENCKG